MKSAAAFINLLIVWGIASATGFVALAALMIMGDWTLLQGLFAAAIIFFVLGGLLSALFLKPLAGPVQPGSAGFAHAESDAPAATRSAPAPAAAPKAEPPSAAAPAAASEGTRPATLDAPRGGTADDLKKIKGVGPKLEKLVNAMGFYHFDQIANWTAEEVAWVDENLEGFKGRVTRDGWVEQARLLASGADTEFSKRVDEGDVY
jgi:predicted flap endonuclease-1-like 5' DNA nuclease